MTDSKQLLDLPTAPAGKQGWPYDIPAISTDSGVKWPRITIITPSYNQGQYIEETIRSVYLQGYPNLQYIIMDGGSKDDTMQVVDKYRHLIDIAVSEKDNGQTHALNKALKLADGDIINWINSDDLLAPGALLSVARNWKADTNWLTGHCLHIDENSAPVGLLPRDIAPSVFEWLSGLARGHSCALSQPSTFFSKKAVDTVGLLNEKWHYSFDHEFLLRVMAAFGQPTLVEETLSWFRIHSESKTGQFEERFKRENKQIAAVHLNKVSLKQQLYLRGVLLLK